VGRQVVLGQGSVELKIALLTLALSGGGAEAVCRGWAAGLIERGCDVEVLAIAAGVTPVSLDVTSGSRIRIHSAPESGATSHLARLRWLRKLLKVERYDALVSLQTYPNLLAIIANETTRRRTPIAISEHNVPSLLLRAEGRAKKVQLFLAKRVYGRANRVISVSHAVATDIRCNFRVSPSKSSVVMNGVIQASATSARSIAPGNRLRVLVPARLAPQKRPEMCIQVLREMARRGVEAELIWIGDATAPSAADPFEGCSNVERYSWREDWHTLADAQTVVLLPSAYEGLGNVLIEAAAHKVPVVAGSNALGCGDAIIPGVTGYFAETDTAGSYADAILRASTLKLDASLDGWLSQFTVARATQSLHEILADMAEGSNAARAPYSARAAM
jgi:glycosyltransferase involved in cell wall biosynthesis